MIDLSYLKTATENDPVLIKELIILFLKQLPDLKNNLLDAYETGNWKALQEAAHKAKSSFQIVGAHTQHNNLLQIEIMAAEQKPKEAYASLICSFKNSCELIVLELEGYLG